MRLYTKTGDKGNTWGSNTIVKKSSCNIECLGDLDELNSSIGLLKSFCSDKNNFTNQSYFFKAISILIELEEIQKILFEIGALIYEDKDFITNIEISNIEKSIDYLQKECSGLKHFILPDGGNSASAQAFISRSICRRAERSLWRYKEEDYKRNVDNILIYLNRLSDLLFIIARYLSNDEIEWKRKGA